MVVAYPMCILHLTAALVASAVPVALILISGFGMMLWAQIRLWLASRVAVTAPVVQREA